MEGRSTLSSVVITAPFPPHLTAAISGEDVADEEGVRSAPPVLPRQRGRRRQDPVVLESQEDQERLHTDR